MPPKIDPIPKKPKTKPDSLSDRLFTEIAALRELILARVTDSEDRLGQMIHELKLTLDERTADTNAAIDDLHDGLFKIGGVNADADDAGDLARRIRAEVRKSVPPGSTIAVATNGDAGLLMLHGKKGEHFPRNPDGSYLSELASADAAMIQLEVLRLRGIEYFVIPRSASGMFERWPEFKSRLDTRFRLVQQADSCSIFSLTERPHGGAKERGLAGALEECQQRLGRYPAVLDWDSGWQVANLFPQMTVFSPPESSSSLPYFNESVDVVVVQANCERLPEARRVAETAVILLPEHSGGRVRIEWKDQKSSSSKLSVSVIIPITVFDRSAQQVLAAWSASISEGFAGELLVVNLCSDSQLPTRLKRWNTQQTPIKIIDGTSNAAAALNAAAMAVASDVIVFAGLDTVPLDGWLAPMLRLLSDRPDAGAVGGKLVTEDGRLRHAGTVVRADGQLLDVGAGEVDIFAPNHSYVRSIGAAWPSFFATRRNLFQKVGGFDAVFASPRYRTADYSIRLRANGHQTYFQSESVAICRAGETELDAEHLDRIEFVRRHGASCAPRGD